MSIRSVWSRVGAVSTTTVRPGAFNPAKRDCRFYLCRGDRWRIGYRNWFSSSVQGYRQQSALATVAFGTEQTNRFDDPRHRPRPEGRIPGESDGDRACTSCSDQKANPGSGIFTIDDIFGLGESACSNAINQPVLSFLEDHRTELPYGRHGRKDIFAFEKITHMAPANRHRRQDQSTMGDRLVSGHGSNPMQFAPLGDQRRQTATALQCAHFSIVFLQSTSLSVP